MSEVPLLCRSQDTQSADRLDALDVEAQVARVRTEATPLQSRTKQLYAYARNIREAFSIDPLRHIELASKFIVWFEGIERGIPGLRKGRSTDENWFRVTVLFDFILKDVKELKETHPHFTPEDLMERVYPVKRLLAKIGLESRDDDEPTGNRKRDRFLGLFRRTGGNSEHSLSHSALQYQRRLGGRQLGMYGFESRGDAKDGGFYF
ncbi:uncharacterized protein JCM15063_006185 [Sporobolomyces koalae]|uniref:uncharacterized protein n=1 Tax=Sporobolomyces koalae TaxID=500713 RepID=UPI0031761806